MPATSIRDLVIKDDDLVIDTHGRSFWILDDISPLRQLTTELTKAESILYKPQRAYRVRWNMNRVSRPAPRLTRRKEFRYPEDHPDGFEPGIQFYFWRISGHRHAANQTSYSNRYREAQATFKTVLAQ